MTDTISKRPEGPDERDPNLGGQSTRRSRQLVESLVAAWSADARLLGNAQGAGELLAEAGEAVEFGIGDRARALELYRSGCAHPDADPRAFAGVRRSLRAAASLDHDALLGSYEAELAGSRAPLQAVLAGVGYAQCALRAGRAPGEIAQLMRELQPLIGQVPHDVSALFRSALEDVLLANAEHGAALQSRATRWGELRLLGEEVAESQGDLGAMAIAVASEVVGSELSAVLDWYEVAFELRPSAVAAQPLLRAAFDADQPDAAEAILAELADAVDDTNTRSASQYAVGMLRAHRLGDRPGGLSALGEAMKAGAVSPLAAFSYLGLARSSQGSVVADDYIDALGASLDFAASGVERADLLTQMAERFDAEQGMAEAAVDLARDALLEQPDYVPALRLLGSLYAREGRWQELVQLTEQQLERETHPEERFRLHDQLAERYDRDLMDPAGSERHLREALTIRADLSVVRRLARLLGEQYRWEELYEHLRASASAVESSREMAYLLERAGEVAEAKLRSGELAIDTYQALLEVAPDHTSALTALGRLLSRHERWHELLALNERELALSADRNARVGILCRSAEVARNHLGDIRATESFYERALEEDPACSAALRGLGQILSSQARWAELVAMTEREMTAAHSDAHRRRCQRLLGELYATRLNDRERAVACFESLASSGQGDAGEALIWLERLFEADGADHDRLGVLVRRFDACEEPKSRARLAFRIAELLEWRLGEPADAFEHYVESLADPVACAVALSAIDRLWRSPRVDDELRAAAVQCMRALASDEEGEIRRTALRVLADRATDMLSAAERLAMHREIAAEWPEDLRSAEYSAVASLIAGDASAAEEHRALAPSGPVEAMRAGWGYLDRGLDLAEVVAGATDVLPNGAAMLAREIGAADFGFDGVSARDTYQRLGQGTISLGELTHPDDTEAGFRLAAYAHRELGDADGLQAALEELATRIQDPIRAMRVWLELAGEDSFKREQRIGWLQQAVALGCFDSPVRVETYDALGGLQAWSVLEQAIAEHLREGVLDSREAATLSLRRGRCLEADGRRDDAIDALRFSAIHAPADATVALEKARLETLVDDLDAARSSLEDCLNAGVDGEHRIEVLGRLADLHQMNGGVRQRALGCLEDAYLLSGKAPDWAVRLASAHAGFGQPQRCVDLLRSALTTPPQESDIRNWQLLAKVLSTRLEAVEEGEEILWSLFEAFPTRSVTLNGLEEFYRKFQGARAFAERLGELLTEGVLEAPEAKRAELWTYVGELNFTVLGRFPEAEDAYARARRIGGASASTLLREAKAAGKQPGRLRDAAKLVVDALAEGSDDVALWEDAALQLEALYEELAEPGRLRVARQLRRALGASIEPDDALVKRDPSRELEPESAWRMLAEPPLDLASVGVLQGAVGLAEKVLARYAPSKKEFKGRRLKREEFSGFDRFLESACSWLGVARPRVIVGEGQGGVRALEAASYWVPAHAISDDHPRAARFWAGYIAGLLFSDLVPYTWAGDDAAVDMLLAVAESSDVRVPTDGRSTMTEEVSKLLLRPQRRQAAAALSEFPEVIEARQGSWSTGVVRLADRAGLLACGDLAVAVEQVAVAEGWQGELAEPRTRQLLVRSERGRALLLFAMSDAYALARYESGLGERPYLFT